MSDRSAPIGTGVATKATIPWGADGWGLRRLPLRRRSRSLPASQRDARSSSDSRASRATT